MKIIKTAFLAFLFLFISCNEYKKEEYTVTFNANGASGTPPAPINIKNDDTYGQYPLPSEGNLKYEDMSFYGWNMKADGSGKLFYSGYPYILDHINSNTILYAQWIELKTVTNLRYSFGDGIYLNFDGAGDFPKLEDYQGNPEMMWNGRMFIAYVLFRNYTVFPDTDTPYNNSNGFEPHMISFTPNFRDTQGDFIYGGTFEYFAAICRITNIANDEYGYTWDVYNCDIIVGPHSNIVSFEIRGDGTPLVAPKSFKAVLYETNSYGETMVYISWKDVPRAYGYRLYYSYDNNNYFNVEGNTVTVLHKTNYIDYIPEGSTVYYKVTAVNNMMENGYFSNPVIPRPPNTPGTTYMITLKNNHANAVSRAYTRNSYTNSWGSNCLINPVITNNQVLLGNFEPDIYEVISESVEYYRINTGANDRGLNITGGILEGYQPIYYLQPEFELTRDTTITVPATGWIKIKPE